MSPRTLALFAFFSLACQASSERIEISERVLIPDSGFVLRDRDIGFDTDTELATDTDSNSEGEPDLGSGLSLVQGCNPTGFNEDTWTGDRSRCSNKGTWVFAGRLNPSHCECDDGYSGVACEVCALNYFRQGERCIDSCVNVGLICESGKECNQDILSPECICTGHTEGPGCSVCLPGYSPIPTDCDGFCLFCELSCDWSCTSVQTCVEELSGPTCRCGSAYSEVDRTCIPRSSFDNPSFDLGCDGWITRAWVGNGYPVVGEVIASKGHLRLTQACTAVALETEIRIGSTLNAALRFKATGQSDTGLIVVLHDGDEVGREILDTEPSVYGGQEVSLCLPSDSNALRLLFALNVYRDISCGEPIDKDFVIDDLAIVSDINCTGGLRDARGR